MSSNSAINYLFHVLDISKSLYVIYGYVSDLYESYTEKSPDPKCATRQAIPVKGLYPHDVTSPLGIENRDT